MRRTTRRNPRALLKLYSTGSFAVLLLCLVTLSVSLSMTYLKREEARSKIFQGQLQQFFEFHYRTTTEQMWTANYEAIGMRVSEIANQLGGARFHTYLAKPSGECVLETGSDKNSTGECRLPQSLLQEIKKVSGDTLVQPSWNYDYGEGAYLYVAPLYVSSVLQGFQYVWIHDPYGFARGNGLVVAGKIFLPSILIVLLAWGVWLMLSRRLLLRPYMEKLVQMERKQALGDLAAQVAHDIHSPLATLMSVVRNTGGLPTSQAKLLTAAASRIQKIADELILRYRERDLSQEEQFAFPSAVIQSIVAEKVAMLGERKTIEIISNLDPNCIAAGVPVSCTELSRVLSNLLDNSIDALQSHPNGSIVVSLQAKQPGSVEITVKDNGIGIENHVLSRLRTSGGTYGKVHGAGMGLRHARSVAQSASGHLMIDSEYSKGTVVTIELPTAPTPGWCASALDLSSAQSVVVLDDDESVHLLWKSRLGSLVTHYLKDPTEFDAEIHLKPNTFYVLDLEIAGSDQTGLDLIRKFRLGSQATLVTSYFNESKIQIEVMRLGARILPKFMIPQVPVLGPSQVQSQINDQSFDLVLIDDDSLVHQLWMSEAKRNSQTLLAVHSEAEFFSRAVPLNTKVFVDKNLGNGEDGAQLALKLHEHGYTEPSSFSLVSL